MHVAFMHIAAVHLGPNADQGEKQKVIIQTEPYQACKSFLVNLHVNCPCVPAANVEHAQPGDLSVTQGPVTNDSLLRRVRQRRVRDARHPCCEKKISRQ